MEVIPAVDIKGGKCVRLAQGRAEDETVYGEDPVAAAKRWQECGAERIHVVDLDGAFAGEPKNLPIVKEIVAALDIPVQVGGGIRTRASIEDLLAAGADRAILGTRALEDRGFLSEVAGLFPGKIALGLDVKGGKLATRGWLASTDATIEQVLADIGELPLAAIVHTDVARDGMLAGPNLASLRRLVELSKHPVIASGGITSVDHVAKIRKIGAAAVIIGTALYTGDIMLAEALEAAK